MAAVNSTVALYRVLVKRGVLAREVLGRAGSLHTWDSVQFTELLTLTGRRRVTKVRRIECEPHFI
jgi:hypothetical protein